MGKSNQGLVEASWIINVCSMDHFKLLWLAEELRGFGTAEIIVNDASNLSTWVKIMQIRTLRESRTNLDLHLRRHSPGAV